MIAGPYCNMECPETFVLGDLTSNNWPSRVKIAIICIVMGIGLIALVLKVLFVLWLCWLERMQRLYLESLEDDFEGTDTTLQVSVCDCVRVSLCLSVCLCVSACVCVHMHVYV